MFGLVNFCWFTLNPVVCGTWNGRDFLKDWKTKIIKLVFHLYLDQINGSYEILIITSRLGSRNVSTDQTK